MSYNISERIAIALDFVWTTLLSVIIVIMALIVGGSFLWAVGMLISLAIGVFYL